MHRIYFDNAATTPLDPEVIEVMVQAMRDNFGNPSSIYAEGRTARAAIEQARKQVAHYLGASIGEIFFTSGGTESNNMALKNAVRDLGVRRIISSPIEHHCVLHSLDALKRLGQVEVAFVRLDEKGRVDKEHLAELLQSGEAKTMVSLMHSNNEIGTMIDMEEVSRLCREQGALFHSDTVQTMGYYPFDLSKTPVSFLSGSAHKFYGPKGCGFIYINGDNIIKPFVDGGSQERNMRGGTENIYGILGLAKALSLAYDNLEARRAQTKSVRDYLRQQLDAHFDNLQYNGDPDDGHYKLLSVAFPPSPKADLLLLNLDIAGISVSGGSACSSGADAGSHVIEAMKGDPARKTIRFSFSHHNTKQEVDVVVEKLREILKERHL
ncbi:MAG: cysteine desulfurase [Phaeodactylibacter sp.]|nr:cysteine desulfurase [Phaeodactylibacter sp.]MCB9303365.1 cysteine desulfurase [Lewinellaceae bacterium]